MSLLTFEILGVRVSAVNLESACDQMESWISQKAVTYVCVAPVSTVLECHDNEKYRHIVNAAGMVTPDGMPVVWYGRSKTGKMVERTYGPDLMNRFLSLSESKGYRHFFYGGSSITNHRLVEQLKIRFPKLIIAGNYAPSFLTVGQKEDPAVIEQINASKADVLWVGLGAPKQDFWMAAHRDDINVPVMVGVGAAFDFLSGTKAQAPLWMQKSGLEWLFRLFCEPRRLWKRYLIGNAKFVFLLLKTEFLDHKFPKTI